MCCRKVVNICTVSELLSINNFDKLMYTTIFYAIKSVIYLYTNKPNSTWIFNFEINTVEYLIISSIL